MWRFLVPVPHAVGPLFWYPKSSVPFLSKSFSDKITLLLYSKHPLQMFFFNDSLKYNCLGMVIKIDTILILAICCKRLSQAHTPNIVIKQILVLQLCSSLKIWTWNVWMLSQSTVMMLHNWINNKKSFNKFYQVMVV